MRKVFSEHAIELVHRAYQLDYKLFSDPDWSLLEAVEKETPTGIVHLHWRNHRGQGHWELITKPYKNTTVCKTARCRVVNIDPLGGENEAADISRQRYEDAFSAWLNNKNLENIMRQDVEAAVHQERYRKQQIRRMIEDEYGPWYNSEYNWIDSYKKGQWMYELDEELRHIS